MEEENKEPTVSEISIEEDQDHADTYVVKIDNKFFINVTVCDFYPEEGKLREWIREIQAIYGKKNRRNLIVGFSALCSNGNANNGRRSKGNRVEKENPYELLQLCVGSHCLLMELCPYRRFPRVVKEFLYDNRTIVVGVGIERIAEKLEKDREEDGLVIRKRVELRKEAEKLFPGNNFEKFSLEELGMAVFGGEVGFAKPKNIRWWDFRTTGDHARKLTKQMIKYACAEAFLACKMGQFC
ncbi:hypothetical protein DITRI_Ditri03aG0146400 [Diplodiscus trichospermus]